MYRRTLEGRVLNFGHAGILYQQSFVMYDRETQSLWVHVTGEARDGPLKGKRLTFMPSTVTTWAGWKAAYPKTLVLPGYRRGGFMGTYKGIQGGRGLGLVVVQKFKGKLYPFRELRRTPLVQDRHMDAELVIYYSSALGTATAWNRKVDGQILTFRESRSKDKAGRRLLEDTDTGSRWNWLTGEAVQGPLKGQRLGAVLYNPILTNRFHAHYPNGDVWRRK